MDGIYYSADVRVSLPEPMPSAPQVTVPMYGFAFTENGLRHDITRADHDALSTPSFAPHAPLGDVVWGDATPDDDREFV
jgi:hypothetical protein